MKSYSRSHSCHTAVSPVRLRWWRQWTRLSGLFAIGLVVASDAAARGADEFTRTCLRVERALRAENWAAFRRECAGEIVFEHIRRIYLQDYSRDTMSKMFRADDWVRVGYPPVTEPFDDNDRDSIATHCVLLNRPPSDDEKHAFHEFCGYVHETVHEAERGRNLRGEEVKSLFGPAIEGKVASNFKWRVEIERIAGRWKVRKLITEEH